MAISKEENNLSILRFVTLGSVDNGKSTLLGRLMSDLNFISDDKIKRTKEIANSNNKFAYLADGLEAEREQNITIDVAHLYFRTKKRVFIAYDSPGHKRYIKNMATATSYCDLAVILIDVKKEITNQTKYHTFIASLFGIKNIVLLINKMDLVEYHEENFNKLTALFKNSIKNIDFTNIYSIPISALNGDNITSKSLKMPWYKGKTLIQYLEDVELKTLIKEFRYGIQYITKNNKYLGQVLSGDISVNDKVLILPLNQESKIREIEFVSKFAKINLEKARSGQSVSISLDKNYELKKGDLIVNEGELPINTSFFKAKILWFQDEKLILNKEYLLKTITKTVKVNFEKINYIIDVENFRNIENTEISKNSIGEVEIKIATDKLYLDLYSKNSRTGNFIIICPDTFNTIGAGLVTKIYE